MSQTYLPLSALCAPKGNPRRTFSKSSIAGLAQSIMHDGVLQNLTVIPQEDGRYRIHIGKRRYLALQMLKRNGDIDDTYGVPVIVKEHLDGGDAHRIATVENIQREALDPIDEAEAFGTLFRGGASLADVPAQTGLSENTVRRRLALASLSKEAKAMVRSGMMPLSIAEALTLGNEAQQRQLVEAVKGGAHLNGDYVRATLLNDRPTKSAAVFDPALYTGTYTTDLFGDENATFFDDADEFLRLQKKAVDEIADKHRKTAGFVDVFNGYSAPWWQYRQAAKGEEHGVVINLSPSGAVEIRKRQVRNKSDENGSDEEQEQTEPRQRPEFGPGLLRYFAHQKTIALMGALAEQPRRMMEVTAVLLLSAHLPGNRIRIEPHSSLRDGDLIEARPKGYAAMDGTAQALIERLGLVDDADKPDLETLFALAGTMDEAGLHGAVKKLADDDLVFLIAFLPLAAFGKDGIREQDDPKGLFASVAHDLPIAMRDWWTPDGRFLSMLRRSQLEDVAIESGASIGLGKIYRYKKKDLVVALANYFLKTSDSSAELDQFDAKGRSWLPRLMRLVEEEQPSTEDAA
ncbi:MULTISPECIES: ParB/RepB/Spo0J family partition protein [unclassified Mesorhizobium]|uniref:ParB/RepB/Spo0J family partition protein n=1 Tax=unclassified Mesorhizobium TaxID=325217 RepID=UPI0003CE9388|nr:MULTISPECIES: ParB/RepB/Spo0J family partition protein [unclassified Mesorhizobium]ESY51886.1 Fis family transcriptional regulator [Mesorhizobium sp. LNJC374B00]ESY55925.1 Fis family transcriptional regulator [Mesorhizobium sp. LNJC372A00]WJI81259.1 ParB/RepB/Spo0J family partition protein [Mesorhizobium sp. C374B]WJI87778.1 ParB/RepB/Spo0J family partition protein [Mesorhizobium sp. C372A]